MGISKTIAIKLAYLALVGGFALGIQGCAKKSFESVQSGSVDKNDNGTNNNGGSNNGGSNNGGTNNGGSNNGGSNNGGTNNGGSNNGGSNNGGTNNGGSNNGGSNNGGTNNGGSNNGGTNNGGSNNGGTNNGGSNNGGSNNGGTNNGGSNNGCNSGCNNGGTTGGTNNGGTTGGTNNGGTTGGTNNGGTTGGTNNGGTTGGTNNGGTTGGTNNGGTTGGTTGGCDPFNPHCTHDTKYCVTERYQQPDAIITRKLDVLVITDSSSSMDQEREKLANGITTYISKLPANTDAQFAVTLAHGNTSWFSGRLYKSDFKDPKEKYVLSTKDLTNSQIQSWMRRKLLYSQKNYSLPAFDSNGNPNSNAQRALPTDFDADGGEAGLLSLWNMVRPYSGEKSRYASLQDLASEIPGERGFFREDAAFAVIFISDENDICYLDPSVPDSDGLEATFNAAWCSGITAHKVLQRLQVVRKSMPLYVSSIIYNNKATVPAGLENGVGLGYKLFTQLANGTIIDIAQNAISSGLSTIGSFASSMLDLRLDFILKYQNVVSSTIKVKVDNTAKPHTYSSTTNTVHLAKANAGSAKSLIDIYYCMPINTPLVPYEIQISTHLINTCKKTYQPNVVVEEKE